MMLARHPLVFAAGSLSAVCAVCFAAVYMSARGEWPDSWPKELEPLREHARTIDVAHGIQERVYEISFTDPLEFEKAWPHFAGLKSKGAPVIIESSPSTYGRSGSTMGPGVRILCPSGGTLSWPDSDGVTSTGFLADWDRLIAEGKALRASPPWPKSVLSPAGDLPEYVVAVEAEGKREWRDASKVDDKLAGFKHRARVDIMLIVDDEIVDVSRIPLLRHKPIIDKRAKKGGVASTQE